MYRTWFWCAVLAVLIHLKFVGIVIIIFIGRIVARRKGEEGERERETDDVMD